tara:strand:- start:3732 stop:4556 length:825 start_codon:yes stop_codon:yes gene_type:complete
LQKSEHYFERLDGFIVLEKKRDIFSLYFQHRGSFRKLCKKQFQDEGQAYSEFEKAIAFASDKANLHDFLNAHYKDQKSKFGLAWGLYEEFFLKAIPEFFNSGAAKKLKIKIPEIHDKMRFKLYRFERQNEDINRLNSDMISLDEAQEITRQVCERYGVEIADVMLETTHNGASYYDLETKTLTMGHLDRGAVLHEVTHHVHYQLSNQKLDQELRLVMHGPEFAKILIDIYSEFGGADKERLLSDAQSFGLLGPDKISNPNMDSYTSRQLFKQKP